MSFLYDLRLYKINVYYVVYNIYIYNVRNIYKYMYV